MSRALLRAHLVISVLLGDMFSNVSPTSCQARNALVQAKLVGGLANACRTQGATTKLG